MVYWRRSPHSHERSEGQTCSQARIVSPSVFETAEGGDQDRKAQHKVETQHPGPGSTDAPKEADGRPKEIKPWYQLSDDDMKLYLDQIIVPKNTLLMDPTTSHLLRKNENSADVFEMKAYQDIDTYDFILAPVNDRTAEEREGGGHWSLLLYARDTNTYYHLDSLEPHNNKYAEQLAAQLSGDPSVDVVQLRCCRQKSSVECGVYVLHFCDLVCSLISN